MNPKLSVGILGTGIMGRQLGQRLQQRPDVEVTAICGTSLEKAQALQRDLQAAGAATFADFDRLLAERPPQALFVCLPPFAHAGQVEKAAAQGIHLFLEKPIAYDLAGAEAMVAAIEQHGVVSQVGYHMRFRRSTSRFKQLLEAGLAGQPTLFQGRFWCNFTGPDWWRDRSKSNGQIFEQLVHIYDLALHFLGEPAVACGFSDNLCHQDDPSYTIEDTSIGLVRFKNGALASVSGSNCAVPGVFNADYQVACTNATLAFASGGDWRAQPQAVLFTHSGGEVQEERFSEDLDLYTEETEAFVQAVRSGGPSPAPASQGLQGIRLVTAVLASAAQGGRPVDVSSLPSSA